MEHLRCPKCGDRVHPSGVHHSGDFRCQPTAPPCPEQEHRWTRTTSIIDGMDLLECVKCGTWATPAL